MTAPSGTRPARRAVLRALAALPLAGLAGGGLAGCGLAGEGLRLQPLDGDPEPAPLAPDADELARLDLLAGVRELRGAVAAEATAPGRSAEALVVTAALGAALEETERALEPAPPASAPVAGAPVDLPAVLAAAADRASALLPEVTPAMARLVAAVAAGHRVAAAVLTGADAPPSAAPEPLGRADAAAVAVALRAEGAARYAYPVLAVHLLEPAVGQALAHLEVHRLAVVRLQADLAALGADPEPPAGGYALPAPVVDAASALALAAALEDGTADAWADLVGAVAPEQRTAAAATLTDRALRAAAWRRLAGRGAELRALPGLSGR